MYKKKIKTKSKSLPLDIYEDIKKYKDTKIKVKENIFESNNKQSNNKQSNNNKSNKNKNK